MTTSKVVIKMNQTKGKLKETDKMLYRSTTLFFIKIFHNLAQLLVGGLH